MSLENEIIGVDHLGILTGDLKRDVAWYEEKLCLLYTSDAADD